MIDIIVSIILVAIIGGAITYIVKAKKNGQKCIGCPHSKTCSGKCGCTEEERK
ncbi:MAG: FeoB-associated Cys-rich membrane protein [Ruminococcaceae bacterium]|nr:FeoB-associated Cys-rich membrane protein [Oscillospiraceae bacterium]